MIKLLQLSTFREVSQMRNSAALDKFMLCKCMDSITTYIKKQQHLVLHTIYVQYSVSIITFILLVALFATLLQYPVTQATSVQFKMSFNTRSVHSFDARSLPEARDKVDVEKKEEKENKTALPASACQFVTTITTCVYSSKPGH